MSFEDPIVDLQTRLAYQEDTIARLNEVLTDQQRQIDRLRAVVDELVHDMSEKPVPHPAGAVDEPPPHY